MVFVYKNLAQFAVRCALPPRRSESPICATVNKPSCVLHLLGWFIGSRGFSSLEPRPEFWVLQDKLLSPDLGSEFFLEGNSEYADCISVTVKKEFIGPGLHLGPVCADLPRPPLQWTLNSVLSTCGNDSGRIRSPLGRGILEITSRLLIA